MYVRFALREALVSILPSYLCKPSYCMRASILLTEYVQAAWSKVADHVRAVSPGTMMLPGPDGCINPGEGGEGSYPVYHYVNDTNMCSYPWMLPKAQQAASSPSPNGQIYVPYESDLSIQNPGDAWFYHEGHPFLNAGELWTHYLAVAGRGSHFILNVPPNRSGK